MARGRLIDRQILAVQCASRVYRCSATICEIESTVVSVDFTNFESQKQKVAKNNKARAFHLRVGRDGI